MLEAFYHMHDFLVEHAHMPIRRLLMDEIDWSQRLIAIRGGRGVGKTDFLLTRAREIEKEYKENPPLMTGVRKKDMNGEKARPCLYVNLNNFYFTEHSLYEFVSEFVKAGGRHLLLDQPYKYPNWSKELRKCYDRFKELQIVFSASPVMSLEEDNKDLYNILQVYNLRGFSFREYLNLRTGMRLKPISFEEVLHNHASIATEICEHIHPLNYVQDYLKQGYYPSFLENKNFEADLLKTMNAILEVDVLLIKQIEVSNLPKMRLMLNIMLNETPCPLNISNLSQKIEASRATTMHYIKYLKDARMLNLLYMEGREFPMKPSKVFMQNTNLAFMSSTRQLKPQEICETYFYNAVHVKHKVNATERNAMFMIDNKYYFDVLAQSPQRDPIRPSAIGDIEIGRGNSIPLWMLGLLY